MDIRTIKNKTVSLHACAQGEGPPVVFANSLGSTLAIWDEMIAAMPDGLRIIRFDLRGHGQSDVPPAPYTMGALVSDAEAVFDAFEVKDAVLVGLSVGGMIAQGLAVKRLDLVRGLVLSNTAAKIGHAKLWEDRIAAIRAKGMAGFAPEVMGRWFGKDFLRDGDVARWQDMLSGIDPEGYCGICAAIAGTDFYTPTSGLRLPTLGIAGSEDPSTPPDLVRETVNLIPGSSFHLFRRMGHLPCIEDPKAYAQTLTDFLRRIGHLPDDGL